MRPPAARRFLLLLGAVLALARCGGAAADGPAAPGVQLDARLRQAWRESRGGAGPQAAGRDAASAGRPTGHPLSLRPTGVAAARASHAPAWSCFLTGAIDAADLRAAGVTPGTRAGDTWTARVPPEALPRLLRVPGLARVALAAPVRPLLDESVRAVHADTERQRAGDVFTGHTGQGVIVGLVDSGLDLTHPDFKRPDGTSRVLAAWDQNDTLGPPAAGFGYGTEWSGADIDAGHARAGDAEAHGTHVAGIAAGNGGPERRYVGLAPNADLVVVAIDFNAASVVDGVDYVFRRAAALGRPAVVNLSLGTQGGPHDGSDPFDRAIGALTGPGRVVVAAAGNEGADRIHAAVPLGEGRPVELPLRVPTYPAGSSDANFIDLEAWYAGEESLLIAVRSPLGTLYGPFRRAPGDTTIDTPQGRLFIAHQRDLGQSGFLCELNDSGGTRPAPGDWALVITPVRVAGPRARLDAWLSGYAPWVPGLPADEFSAPWFPAFREPAALVGSPASAARVIAVGSYNTRDCWPTPATDSGSFCVPAGFENLGEASSFSCPGPTRSGARKPDLLAPGFTVVSALSAQLDPAVRAQAGVLITPDGAHWIEVGTSMACPHVTGAVALLLEQEPTLGPEEVRERLHRSADRDSLPGQVYNGRWGYGTLNVARLLNPGAAGPGPALLAHPWPNPAAGEATRLEFLLPARAGEGSFALRLFDTRGRLVRELAEGRWGPEAAERRVDWDGRDAAGRRVAGGVYFARLTGPALDESRRVVRLP